MSRRTEDRARGGWGRLEAPAAEPARSVLVRRLIGCLAAGTLLLALCPAARSADGAGARSAEGFGARSADGAFHHAEPEGEFVFLANAHTLWVGHRESGRLAGYRYLDGETRQVERSRIRTLDRRIFPEATTRWALSDRSRTDVIWALDHRSGAVELFNHRSRGEVDSQRVTSVLFDLTAGVGGARDEIEERVKENAFLFRTNRRSVWVIHPGTGRAMGFHFRDDQERTVQRTKIVEADRSVFPPEDTEWLLSDKNLAETLWIANRRTGVFQIWTPRGLEGIDSKEIDRVREDLGGEGELRFFANRRTLWAVEPTVGQLVPYRYRDTLDGTVEKGKPVVVDTETFPAADTDYLLSDHHLTEALWIVNRRTGDVQLVEHLPSGSTTQALPVRTYLDLVPAREPQSSSSEDRDPSTFAADGFEFLPIRKTMWVVHRASGRFAGFSFESEGESGVGRTEVGAVDPFTFPPEETVWRVSDLNFAAAVWAGNAHTGDFQMFSPTSTGALRADRPMSTMTDLANPAARGKASSRR